MMSGSGTLLYFHIGVVKALFEQGLLPTILSGASGGSVVGSLLCTHTDDQLREMLTPEYLAQEVAAESPPLINRTFNCENAGAIIHH